MLLGTQMQREGREAHVERTSSDISDTKAVILLGKSRSTFKQVKWLNVIRITQQSQCSLTFNLWIAA